MNSKIGMRCEQLARLKAVAAAVIGASIIAPASITAQEISEDRLSSPAMSGADVQEAIEITPAAPPTMINCPYTITSPGHYKLGASCERLQGNAITIQASDVHLDLGGFTISGSQTRQLECGNGPAVHDGIVVKAMTNDVQLKSVRIFNGRIEGFVFAISLLQTDGGQLKNLKLMHDCNGIFLRDAHDNHIHDNTVSENEQFGIDMRSSNGNWVLHNTVNSNGVSGNTGGVELVSSNHNIIGFNEIDGSRNWGVLLASSSDDPRTGSHKNVLIRNVIRNTNSGGIKIGPGSDMTIVVDNISSNNKNGGDGIAISSSENLVLANRTDDNTARGIVVVPGGIRNFFQRNTAHGNRFADAMDQNPPPECVNIWRQNDFGTKSGPSSNCID